MSPDRGSSVASLLAIAGSEDTPSHLREQITWTPRDVSLCHAIGLWLQLGGFNAIAQLLRQLVVELATGIREPRLADAYQFLHAGRALLKAECDDSLVAHCQQFGLRIAAAVTGILGVQDIRLLGFGASQFFAVVHDRLRGRAARMAQRIAAAPGVVMRNGYKSYDAEDDTCGCRWCVLPASAGTDEVLIAIAQAADAIGFAYDGGPGRPFANEPHVRRSRTRALVTQRVGLDI